ncbi:MAG: mechanosensitive ion channel, partial [Deltaproteobacteria bacterium]|nr:mechanosensitive ion channel [Deltaproteobacteria bacterium]
MPEVSKAPELLKIFDPSAIPVALAWILGAIAVNKLFVKLLARISERFSARRLVLQQAGTLIAFAAYAVAFALAFTSMFDLSPEALFALSGTAAVTIGFALKDVAASFLAGITILVSKPFQVGDRVTFEGFYGEVKEIGLRSVRIVTLDDNLVTIPSNKLLTEPIASANAGSIDCMVVVPFQIAPAADHARAREIVRDAVVASKYLLLGKPYNVLLGTRLTEQGSAMVELTAKAYVYDMRHEKAFASDITDRVLT